MLWASGDQRGFESLKFGSDVNCTGAEPSLHAPDVRACASVRLKDYGAAIRREAQKSMLLLPS